MARTVMVMWLLSAALCVFVCEGVDAAEAGAAARGSAAGVIFSDGIENPSDIPEGWSKGSAVPGVKYTWDKTTAFEGKASLCLEKTANKYFPIAQWVRTFEYDGSGQSIAVSAQVKADKVTKAIIDVQFEDASGKWLHEWAAYIGQKNDGDPVANHDWREYGGAVAIPAGTKNISIALQIYGPGKVWFDKVEAGYEKAASKGGRPGAAASEAPGMAGPFADSFEKGAGDAPEAWAKTAAVPGVAYIWDKSVAQEGNASLCLEKTVNKYFPIAGWTRSFEYDGKSPSLTVSAQVKAKDVTKAIIDVQFYDAAGASLHEWASYIGAKEANDPPANHDWKEYSGKVKIPAGTKTITIALQIYGPGKVWFDGLNVSYAR